MFLGKDAMVISYIDDSIVYAISERMIEKITYKLKKTFSIKNLSKPEHYSGTELPQHEDGSVTTKLTNLTNKILGTTGMSKPKPIGS